MAKYKDYSYDQGVFLPVYFDKQILPGTFEYTLNHLIDNELDISFFDQRYKNDETGAPAYDPRILLKVILFAYSRGITSSRKIAQCCEENITFMALSANTRPHFTTIADFISNLDERALALFKEIILVCDEMGLIGKDMFALDGCKLPSNASKEWSGTKKDFKKKCIKLERAIERIVKRHRDVDHKEDKTDIIDIENQYIETLKKQINKIKDWTDDNDDKPGSGGRPVKSNITDNDSAKMMTSNGVIQGYNGVAMVDDKHQVVVAAQAFGKGPEQSVLKPMIENTRQNLEPDVFKTTKLTADSGFHSKKNIDMLLKQGVDSYVADRHFRKRDPRFDNSGRYKLHIPKSVKGPYTTKDFIFDPDLKYCICPANKRLYRNGSYTDKKGFTSTRFKAPKSACLNCSKREHCLRHPDKTTVRQVAFYHERRKAPTTAADKMKQKIDSPVGKRIYSKRIGAVEPVFANIRHALGLNRFGLRGKIKVNCQWLLFCAVHNLKKIHRYGMPQEA